MRRNIKVLFIKKEFSDRFSQKFPWRFGNLIYFLISIHLKKSKKINLDSLKCFKIYFFYWNFKSLKKHFYQIFLSSIQLEPNQHENKILKDHQKYFSLQISKIFPFFFIIFHIIPCNNNNEFKNLILKWKIHTVKQKSQRKIN